MTALEPREIFPFVMFAGRPSLASVDKDFRAKVVNVDDALPPSQAKMGNSTEEVSNPKSSSSVMDSVTPSGPDSFVTPTQAQTVLPIVPTSPPADEGNLASVVKDSPTTERPPL